MKKFKVRVDIFLSDGRKETKILTVESGNKKLASIRALGEISKDKRYKDLFKSVQSLECVA
jgi:hypothetical protein